MDMRKLVYSKIAKKKEVVSLLVTVGIILGLVFAGTVEAVKVDVITDKSVYKDNDKVLFTIGIDIQKDEIIPFTEIKLVIYDNLNNIVKECSFAPDGSNTCPNIDVTSKMSGLEAGGILNGDGWGFNATSDELQKTATNFGYGYGYGAQQKMAGLKWAELVYEVLWDVVADNVNNGKYRAEILAKAEQNAVEYTYTNRAPHTFHVQLTPVEKAIILDRVRSRAEDGTINDVNGFNTFDEVKNRFRTNLRHVEQYGINTGKGSTSIDLYGEKADSTKITVNIDFDNHEILTFTQNKVEIFGDATVKFKKTKKGIFQNGAWVGSEPNEQFEIEIEDLQFTIEAGVVTIISTDPDFPLDVEMPVTQFSFS